MNKKIKIIIQFIIIVVILVVYFFIFGGKHIPHSDSVSDIYKLFN